MLIPFALKSSVSSLGSLPLQQRSMVPASVFLYSASVFCRAAKGPLLDSPCFDFKAYRPQSVPTSSFVAGSVGAGDGDGGSEGGGRVRAGGRARGSAEDGAVPLTGRRCRCRARRGWCRARCGGGLRGMPLLRIQGRLPRRVRAERAHPQSGMIHKLCY